MSERRQSRASAKGWVTLAVLACGFTAAVAGQGAGRMLYTSPNTAFIEQRTGEVVVTANDTSGSIATLQTAIDNARSANPTNVIVIRLTNAVYSVSNAGLVLGSRQCLVASGATLKAANASVTVPLITIASGATNVSVAGGTLDGSGANIQGVYAPAAARVNIDKVNVRNCGLDCILLKGQGNSTYDNEMTVTRCEVSGSPLHAGISVQNSTQTVVADNNCHDNLAGIWLSCAWAVVANNTCHHNTTGIEIAGGNDNVIVNNTCDQNGTGIGAGASNNMITSDSMGGNSTTGINSNGSGNTFVDNLFTGGNASNFTSSGSGNRVVAYKVPLSASGQNYFYPPLMSDQHTNATIVNGMGRTDLTISSTTIASVQSQYDATRAANPNNVIVLHLNGTFTVGASPLLLSSNTCVLLNGTIQINAATTASAAIADSGSPSRVCISGGIIDGGNFTGNNGIEFSSSSMIQVDAVTLRNFGPSNPRSGGSDIIHFSGGSTPYIVTRCYLNGGSSRGIWLQLNGPKSVISDNEVTDVNQDGVDCDSSTKGSVVKYNYCHDLVRYGVFIEQSAAYNVTLGNICNNTGRDINLYNNYATYRAPVERNTVAFNWCYGNIGIRNGSTGTNTTVTSHNFLFNNTVVNASITSEPEGSDNYYSQNYHVGSLTTSGVELFFNSARVSTNLFFQDRNSGLAVLVQNAAIGNGAAIVLGSPGILENDLWALIPTDSGYYQIKNKKSGLVMAVTGAATNAGALVIQWAFGSGKNDQWMPISAGNGFHYFVNRLSGLCLTVSGAGTASGTQLSQQPYTGVANQQFNLMLTAPPSPLPFDLSASPVSQTVLLGGSTNFAVSVTANAGFTGIVSFALGGLPANTTAAFTPTSVTNSGASQLSLTTSSNALVGTYPLTITATSPAFTNPTVVALILATNVVIEPGSLVAWLTFDDNTANDFSGYGNHGTLMNGASIIPDPQRGRVLLLDGANDYVDLGNGASLDLSDNNQATIAAWVKLAASQNHNTILSKGEWKEAYALVVKGDTVPDDQLWTGNDTSVFSGSSVPLNTWTHVAITINGDLTTFYMNGQVAGTANQDRGNALDNTATGVSIGREQYAGSMPAGRWFFNGQMDDVRIYERALTQAEIQSVMVGTPPTTSPRIAGVAMNGTNLILGGTNGVPGGTYYLLTSTNIALPLASWARAATNVFEANGSFSLTNTATVSAPQQFFLLQLGP